MTMMNGHTAELTRVHEAPATLKQKLPLDLEQYIEKPGVPRADKCPSKERPEGHYAVPKGRTPLMQHLDFFDWNKDGKIYVWETFYTLTQLRFAWEPFNTIISFWVALIFHLAFAFSTWDMIWPDPFLTIYTKNAHRMIHGSSSKTTDHEGRFIPEKFEQIWTKYDSSGRGRLSFGDIVSLVYNQAQLGDVFGIAATAFQWFLAWWLFHDEHWQLRKNDVRGLYDGTAFYRLADRNGSPWYGMSARRDAVAKKNMG
eukprot:jgi/Chrzof1/14676/Cz09g11210.t1